MKRTHENKLRALAQHEARRATRINNRRRYVNESVHREIQRAINWKLTTKELTT